MALLTKKIVAGGCVALLAGTLVAHAATPTIEYQVKASYLYNFARFITWPDNAFSNDGKFNLCVVGAERFGGALDALVGERVEERAIAVQRLERAVQAPAARCHLLFLAAGTPEDEPADIGSRPGMLTVGETPGFLARGGIINLVDVGGRIRFEINQPAAQQAQLTVSSRLLSLAAKQP